MKNSKIENENQHDMIHLTKVQNHDECVNERLKFKTFSKVIHRSKINTSLSWNDRALKFK